MLFTLPFVFECVFAEVAANIVRRPSVREVTEGLAVVALFPN